MAESHRQLWTPLDIVVQLSFEMYFLASRHLTSKAKRKDMWRPTALKSKPFHRMTQQCLNCIGPPTQTAARAHPNVLQTQTFLGSLWHSSDPQFQISTTYPLTYADRFRIRRPGDGKFALGPHSDGGSLERWEDFEYARVYHSIFSGNWEQYDPFEMRATASLQTWISTTAAVLVVPSVSSKAG